MKQYEIVDEGEGIDTQFFIVAKTEKEALSKAWRMLTDEQRDNCICLGCVDEVEV